MKNPHPQFFSPKVYRFAGYTAIATLLAGVLMALVLIWFDVGTSPVIPKLMLSLVTVFIGSTLLMAFASVSAKDPQASRHKSFVLTSQKEPDPQNEH